MSEHLHPGLHPDADSLNAFLEGMLPDHERLQCLAHLAECPSCREVVFLAQEASPAPAPPKPAPAWRRWIAAAAAACLAVLAVWLYLRHAAVAPEREIVARGSETPPPPAPPSAPKTEAQLPKPVQTSPKTNKKTAGDTMTAPPQEAPNPPVATESVSAPAKATTVDSREELAAGMAGVSGTVTDSTGAALSGATIQVRQPDGTITTDARADVTGQFHVAGLPAGRYELRIEAPGFRQLRWQIDLQPREMAAAKMQLDVGDVSSTVEVTAEAPAIQTATPSVRKKALPGKLPAAITVASGKVMLAVDSAGAVFVSRNSGNSWNAVKPAWSGKVRLIALADPSQASIATFQLTTDSGSVWLSRDGVRWSAAPPQH